MTTTAYDTHFIASDIAFTDEHDDVHLDIQFRKVKRIAQSVFGMAGCLHCMVDFTQMIIDYIQGKIEIIEMPITILERDSSDFIALIHMNGMCLKVAKAKYDKKISIDNITQIPTVIGSGSQYVQSMIDDCPNAVVAVLEAIKHDKYTDGEVKYCSVKREDIHNLEIHPMSIQLQKQVTGVQKEISAANDFLIKNTGKTFHASTDVFYVGTPSPMDFNIGMALLNQGFSKVKEDFQRVSNDQ